MQMIQILWERRVFFMTCLLEHIRISLTAVVCAGAVSYTHLTLPTKRLV